MRLESLEIMQKALVVHLEDVGALETLQQVENGQQEEQQQKHRPSCTHP